MTIAEKLYKLRTDFGLSQKEFAEKAGVSQSAINYWENGKRQPKTSQIKKIAKAFDVALYILIDDKYELEDVTSEAYKKSARFVGDTEMMKPPIFTAPREDTPERKHFKTPEYLFSEEKPELDLKRIIQRINNKVPITSHELEFLCRQALIRLGPTLDKFYSQLNEAGREKADEQIDRLIDQLELLTKIPEYRKEHQTKTAAPEREPQDGETDTQ